MRRLCLRLLLFPLIGAASATAVPLTISYQGYVVVSGQPHEGAAAFKFALIDGTGATVWSNDGTSVDGSEPVTGVGLDVNRGVFGAELGDTDLSNMTPIPAAAFTNDSLRLRVWFDEGIGGFEQLIPDRKIHSVAFAIRAHSAERADIAAEVENIPAPTQTQIDALDTQVQTLTDQLGALDLGSLVAASTDYDDAGLASLGFTLFETLPAASWSTDSSGGAPLPRTGHSAVSIGNEMIIWGGEPSSTQYANTGGRYDFVSGQWSLLPTLGAPSARSGHAAVDVGQEMVVWGGTSTTVANLADGARFLTGTNQWLPVSATDAPTGRNGHVTVTTGDGMVVWGGLNTSSGLLADGGFYSPDLNQWTVLPTVNAPAARLDAEAAYVDDRMIVWGGQDGGLPTEGGRLVFVNGLPDHWEPMSITGAPPGRTGHTLVSTSEGVIVFGGEDLASNPFDDGFYYDVQADTWTPLASTGGPSARSGHSAVWSGTEMLVLFGDTGSVLASDAFAYDRSNDRWRGLSTDGSPTARAGATAVWYGDAVYLFGGMGDSGRLAQLQSLDPKPAVHLYRKL